MPASAPASASSPHLANRLGPGFVLASFTALLATRPAQAEDRLTLKAQSWQEDGKRVRVDSQYALLEAELTPDTRLKVMGLLDTITGATPSGDKPRAPGEPVPLVSIEEQREAWDANLSRQFGRVNIAASYGVSRESDYVSHGYSLNTLTDFNQKNTTLLLGWGHADDDLSGDAIGWSREREKTSDDFIAGLTQLLSPSTSVTANLSFGRATGFLSDPYKIVGVASHPDLPPGLYSTWWENRPREKDKITLFLGANHHFDRLNGALDASYRFYNDSFGISSHTAELRWLQRLGPRVVLEPSVRFYRQSEADFYYPDLDAAGIVPRNAADGETGTGTGPYYSSDYRLSRLQTVNLGLKLSYTFNPHCSVDFAYERYLMSGLDSDTPSDAYSDADVLTAGLKLSF
ncbi:MAG: DUF3570 domain-containing protein [Opitutaceae bacterium]|jgi:hypothetical protein|nr:DUF3570 domain-containing protein [Opitutaceae bacterium]